MGPMGSRRGHNGAIRSSIWIKKGANLSDKSARKEFGLTREEIIEGIRGGKLHCCQVSVNEYCIDMD
jgi:hypothetical protein